MEEKTLEGVSRSATIQENAVYTGKQTQHQEMHFSYSRATEPNASVLQTGSTPETHFLENETSLPQYELRLPNSDSNYSAAGSYGDIPVLITRGSATKGPKGPLVCHIEGCQRDLSSEKKYYKRYRVCMEHLKMNAIYVDGELQRFCQQCGRFHDLARFDGDKRNCRERLNQHNMRRRKLKRETIGSDGSCEDWGYDPSYGKAPKGRKSERLLRKGGSSSTMWTNDSHHHHHHHHPYVQSGHGISTAEDSKGVGSGSVEMVDGMSLSRLGNEISVPPYTQFVEELGLTTTSNQNHEPTNQERESLYSMVVHQVMPSSIAEVSSGGGINADYNPLESSVSGVGDAISGSLSTLLQVSEPSLTDMGQSVAEETPPGNIPFLGGMLQSVCVSAPGGNVPTVPMLLFPSTSGGNQVNAVAIIPTAISSCQTIVPLSLMGQERQQTLPLPVQSAHPIESPVSIPLPDPQQANSGAKEQSSSGEIAPLVSLAFSASGIGQISASSAFHSAISPNQLAQFQMLLARQMSIYQGIESSASSVVAQGSTEGPDTAKTQTEKLS